MRPRGLKSKDQPLSNLIGCLVEDLVFIFQGSLVSFGYIASWCLCLHPKFLFVWIIIILVLVCHEMCMVLYKITSHEPCETVTGPRPLCELREPGSSHFCPTFKPPIRVQGSGDWVTGKTNTHGSNIILNQCLGSPMIFFPTLAHRSWNACALYSGLQFIGPVCFFFFFCCVHSFRSLRLIMLL